MKIWINRAGQNLGTFTLEEVQRGLDQSRFVATDLGWQEGMETWKSLAEFPDLQMLPLVDFEGQRIILVREGCRRSSEPRIPTWT